jgi:hypothetical protein
MKAPDRNCMYCDQHMSYAEVWTPPDFGINSYAGEATHIYLCEHCKSQQDYHASTNTLSYHTFRIGKYQLAFFPESDLFRIAYCSGEDAFPECILELNTLPTHLTPKTTTEKDVLDLLGLQS